MASPLAARIREQNFREQRLRDMRALELQLNRGQIGPAQMLQRARALGYTPGGSRYKAPRGPGGFAAKVIGDLVESGLQTPQGLYQLGILAGPSFGRKPVNGPGWWRYCLPGFGAVPASHRDLPPGWPGGSDLR